MFKSGLNGSMQNGKRFRVDEEKIVECEYNPLMGESKSEEERSSPSTARGAV